VKRREVARALGCSEATVRRFQERGELRAALDESGAYVFDPAQVEELRARRAEAPRRAVRHPPRLCGTCGGLLHPDDKSECHACLRGLFGPPKPPEGSWAERARRFFGEMGYHEMEALIEAGLLAPERAIELRSLWADYDPRVRRATERILSRMPREPIFVVAPGPGRPRGVN